MPIDSVSRNDVEMFKHRPHMNDYQHLASRTAIYPGKGTAFGLWYCLTKLNGEAGEAAEHVGKAFRDDGLIEFVGKQENHDAGRTETVIVINELTPERRASLAKELGDDLWYIAAAARELGFTLTEIASMNLEKLADRSERNALQGSGDNR